MCIPSTSKGASTSSEEKVVPSPPSPAAQAQPREARSQMTTASTFASGDELRALNLIEQPVWVFDIENKAMWWANTAAVSLWSATSLESLLARDFSSDMSEATERRLADYLVRFRNGERLKDQWTFYPNGQGPKTVYTTASGIMIEQGRMAMLMQGIVKEVRDDVDKASLRGVEMLRHLPIAVTQFDIEGNIMDQNPEALDMFGSVQELDADGPQQTAGAGLCDFLKRFCDLDLGKRVLEEIQGGKTSTYSLEAHQRTSQGPRCSAIKVRLTKDPVTNLPVILYSAKDITELEEAKRLADQANMEKSEFLSVVAHELRTPLHQVIGSLELLGHTEMNSEQRGHVELMQTSATTLMTVINDLLDYTKLEGGKMRLESIQFETKAVVKGSLAAVAPLAEQKGLELSITIGNNIPDKLLGDPNRLRQILLNILQNATKFTSSGSVSLSCRRLQHDDSSGRVNLRFEVQDTGIGMSPEFQKRLFHRYQQEHASTARNYGGSGLGLSICKYLVELIGGSIGVESQRNVGSKFFFELPFQQDTAAPPQAPPPVGSTAVKTQIPLSLCERSILVVEDNLINQKVLCAMLRRLKHSVVVVENGLLAVEAVRKAPPDLVLMDVQMPVMDGLEATRQIRSMGYSTSDLPIIGLTASVKIPDYSSIGMTDWLPKPVKLDMLRNSIDKAVTGVDR